MKKASASSQQSVSRRSILLGGSAAVTSFLLFPRYVIGAAKTVAPSDKINIAIIGSGGRGTQNMKELMAFDDVHMRAVCDVMEEADYSKFYYGGIAGRGPAKETVDVRYSDSDATKDYPPCKEFIDFREMLDKETGLDAVVVATPDHNHAITSIEAMKRGLHLYCEKPLARSVYECRRIAEVAKEMGVATQLGNQGHSGDDIRNTVEWIRDGAIGEIREVHAYHNGGTGPGRREALHTENIPIPDGFDWERWLGPTEKRSYHPEYAPYTWRGWWDFGTGAMGDFFCHNADPAFWALELGHPTSIEAEQEGLTAVTPPLKAKVVFEFPKRGELPPVTMTWYSGQMPENPEELEPGQRLTGRGNGVLFVGSKGKIMCAGWGGAPILLPKSLDENYKRPEPSIKRSKGHHRDWLDAIKGGERSSADIVNYSAHLAEVAVLGNAAIRAGEKLVWDGENAKVTNTRKADQFIKPEYFNGWKI